jgi:D-3-phosphoglycerate dehydrogenase / 2-oxoglutarate reductase
MESFKVVLTDQVFPDTIIEEQILAEAGGSLEVSSGARETVLAAAATADALLTTYFSLSNDDIALLERCRIIARYGIGVDNVDVAAAAERGIVVTNVPDYCVEEVGTHALAMVLALLRKLPAGRAEILDGRWGVANLRPMLRPSAVTLGLVGYGRIARHLAKGARALGMRILTYDPYLSAKPDDAELVDFADLLKESDAVSLHAPLTDTTRGMIGAEQLAMMKPTAILVNTSRGPLVKLADLIDALRSGRLAGAGLDVFETEPPDASLLESVPNLVATPHSAFYSDAATRESQQKAATQIVKVMRGEPVDYPVRPAP